MKFPFVFNWDIYEYDIIDLGGTVQFTGNVVEKRRNSVMEDAIVTYGDIQFEARFQRYNYGNANLHCFLYKGVPENDFDANRESPNSRLFMHAFADDCDKNINYLEMHFTRRIKQYGTAAAQIICGILLLLSFKFLHNPRLFLPGILLITLNTLLICVLGSFYKYYRIARTSEHKPWFFAKNPDGHGKDNGKNSS